MNINLPSLPQNSYKGIYLKSEIANKNKESTTCSDKTKINYPVPMSFIGAIVGKPGSGKSSLIHEMLTHENIWFQKFDNVFFMTPSGISNIMPTEKNFCTRFDLAWLLQRIKDYDEELENQKVMKEKEIEKINLDTNADFTPKVKMAILQTTLINPNLLTKDRHNNNLYPKTDIEILKEKTMTQNNKDHHVLVVFDDMIANIHAAQNDPILKSLLYNRRHVAKNFEISVLVTSQKYMGIPSVVRSCFTFVIAFQPIKKDWKTIQDELLYNNNPSTKQRCELHMRGKHQFVYIVFEPIYSIFLNFSTQVE